MFGFPKRPLLRFASSGFFCAMIGFAVGTTAWADSNVKYPDRSITLIVPYPPGGSADLIARKTAAAFTKRTGHGMLIDNRGGAGGNIAAELVSRAAPDGYTLIMGNAPILAINPHLYSKLNFDPVRDFQPITPIAEIPLFLIANRSAPFHSVNDLIKAARARPNGIAYASGSTGSTTHLGMELFKSMAGVNLLHVPYKGSGPALVGIAAGDVPVMFELMPSALPVIHSGHARVLAATTTERSKAYPDVPTVSESGVPGFAMASWFGVLAPAGTPQRIVNYLHGELRAATQEDEFVDTLERMGAVPMSGGPSEFRNLVRTELDRWGVVVKNSGARVD